MKVICVGTTLINIVRKLDECEPSPMEGISELSASIKLDDRVTLIRGNNGSGKTVIAEALSLIGHSSIIPIFTTNDELGGIPLVEMQISLSENDVLFLQNMRRVLLDRLKNPLVFNKLKFHLDDIDWKHTKEAYDNLGPLEAIPKAEQPFIVQFWKTADDFDLKKILANDHHLAKHLRIKAFDENRQDFCNAVRWLVAWNRPRLIGETPETGPWSLSPRFVTQRCKPEPCDPIGDVEHPAYFPGPIGYFNTDMYDFGAGLDIRESPKEMRSHMTSTLVDRLQVVSQIAKIAEIPISDEMKLSGQKYPIRHKDNIEQRWTRLFSDIYTKPNSIPTIKTTHVQSKDLDLVWGDDKKSHEFMSSGENQAFYALCYLENFQTTDSFIILDEPELHLSIKAASRLINDIVKSAHALNTQVVIVTHLPHLFYQAIVDDSKYTLLFLDRNYGGDTFVDVLEGDDAFLASSQDSHVQVDHLVENLRSVQSPSIWFWVAGIAAIVERVKTCCLDHPRFTAILLIGFMAGMGALACFISM